LFPVFEDFSTLYHLQVQNCYKIKKDVSSGTKSPPPKPKDVRPLQLQPQRQPPTSVFTASNATVKEAADTAAYRVADAESKSYLAAEAIKEAEKISLLVEHSDSMLQLAKDIYEQCTIDSLSFVPIICDSFNIID